MTENSVNRSINAYRIHPDDWQIFIKKLFESVPGTKLQEKHDWLSSKLGVTPGTTAAWLNKGQGTPNVESLFAMAQLLKTPLSILITLVQQRLEPPILESGEVDANIIRAIASIPESEIELTAKNLSGLTQAEIYAAITNLGMIARHL